MFRNLLSDADTLIKEHFRDKGRLLVKLLVFQSILIGVLTFLCLTRPGGEDIQAQTNLMINQDAIRSADGTSFLGYFLHLKVQFVSGLLMSVCGLLKYLLLGPLLLAQYLVVFVMWLLGCGKQNVLASTPLVREMAKVCLEKMDDGKKKLMEAVLLLIPSGLLTMLIKKYLGRSNRADGATILLINSKGDWEYAPSNKREAAIKF